jgi:hypothetical protein
VALILALGVLAGCGREREPAEGPAPDTAAVTWPPAPPLLGDARYWEARRVVVVAVYGRGSGAPDSVRVVDDGGDAARAASLRARLETALARNAGLTVGQEVDQYFYALDPLALSVSDRGRLALPAFARARLRQPPFADWLDAVERQDSAMTLDSFLAAWTAAIPEVPAPAALRDEFMAGKASAGVLAVSPDSQYVLDPFAGFEIDRQGRLLRDADAGYALFDARTGDRLTHEVGTGWVFDLGGWVDARRFLLAGWVQLDWPGNASGAPWVTASAPALVIGDLERRITVVYVSAPAGARPLRDLRARTAAVRGRAYPSIVSTR